MEDDLFQAGELIRRGDVPESTVESDVVVMIDEGVDSPSSFFDRRGTGGSDAFAFERPVPAFEFAVGLGIVGAGSDMRGADESDELLEVAGEELGSVVADDAGMFAWELLQGLLQDQFDLEFLHGFAEIPVDDESAHSVQDRDQEIEGSLDVDIGDVDMPVLMGLEGLHEAGSFFGRGIVSLIEASGRFEDAVDRRRAGSDHVVVEHHEGQPAISFEGMSVVEVEDGLPFPVFEPEIPRDQGLVFVDLAIALFPLVELAGSQVEPVEQLLGGEFGTVGPVGDVVDDLVARVVGNPASLQSSPSSFFARTLASMSSAMTSFF